MPREDNRNNPLWYRVQAVTVPKSATPRVYLQTLLDVIDGKRDRLPALWDVRLHWRNERSRGVSQFERDDDFSDAVAESSAGFNSIIRSDIEARLLKVIQAQQEQKRRRRK